MAGKKLNKVCFLLDDRTFNYLKEMRGYDISIHDFCRALILDIIDDDRRMHEATIDAQIERRAS